MFVEQNCTEYFEQYWHWGRKPRQIGAQFIWRKTLLVWKWILYTKKVFLYVYTIVTFCDILWHLVKGSDSIVSHKLFSWHFVRGCGRILRIKLLSWHFVKGCDTIFRHKLLLWHFFKGSDSTLSHKLYFGAYKIFLFVYEILLFVYKIRIFCTKLYLFCEHNPI